MRCACGSREATNLLPKRDETPILNKSASECAATCTGMVRCVAGARHAASCASRAQSLQGGGGISIPLRGGEAVPSDGLCSVRRNTLAVLKHDAQVVLSV